jgi:DNA-binding response OmpR family regulator
VLVIEADVVTRSLVGDELARQGFVITAASDGAAAIRALRAVAVNLVVLDLDVPDVDGMALLAAIRSARPRLPLIALTAGGDEPARLEAFAQGADDCLPKPVSLPELAARIEARLRWRQQDGMLLEAGPLSLDLTSNRASVAGRSVALSSREGSLLAAFLRHAGEVLSRDELLRLVWELEFDPGSNVVDVYVAALRRKLGRHLIETVRGHGYRLSLGGQRLATGVEQSG